MISKEKEKNYHPLINNVKFSKGLIKIINSSFLQKTHHQFLNDYTILGKNFFPGAGYMEIAGALTEMFLKKESFCLEKMEIINTLILNKKLTELISKIIMIDKSKYEILMFTKGQKNTLHARFSLNCINTNIQYSNKCFDIDFNSCYKLDGPHFYKSILEKQIDYGDTFKVLDQIYLSDASAYATFQFNDKHSNGYKYYPPLIYGAFQLFTLHLSYKSLLDKVLYLPGFIDKIFYIKPNRIANNVYINTDVSTYNTSEIFLCQDKEVLMQINFGTKKTNFKDALNLTRENKNIYNQEKNFIDKSLKIEIMDFLEKTLSGIISSNGISSHALVDLSTLIIISATRVFSLFK